jgi:signal transduction histidine kinase
MLRAMLDALPRPLAYVLRHLALGVPLAVVISAFLSIAFNDDYARNLVYSLCIGLICQFAIDLGRRGAARLMGRSGWPGWPVTAVIIVLAVWLGINGGYALAGWLMDQPMPSPGRQDWRTLVIIVTISLVASIAFTLLGWGRARLAASDAQAQRAQRAAAENQLKLLESQLEPHMLFNTLANLRVLIALDPPRAQAMLDRLIAFLRATLNASRVGTHPLGAEFERLDDYLALMAVRMGPRLQVAFDLPPDLRALPVPPLLLQPLVENSIQHGLEPQVEGGRIEVGARRDGDRLLLTVRDSGVGLSTAAAATPRGTGFGTHQVRERLAALYGPAATLVLHAAPDGGALATITIPLEPRT